MTMALRATDQDASVPGVGTPEHARDLPTVNILGVEVCASSLPEVARAVVRWSSHPRTGSIPRFVTATSVHGLIEGMRDPAFRAILNGATCVAPDGMPLVWFGRFRGRSTMRRVYGPALMLEVCRQTASLGVRHFFYGGASGVPEELAFRLRTQYPGLEVAGTFSPPCRTLTDSELAATAERINRGAPDIVWVGLSTPKQERWIASVRQYLGARVVLSVGAAFDFHAGRVRQAPAWMQNRGLEWLFRLFQEPRRLWRRYAYNNPMFVWLALSQLAGLRKFTNETETEVE